MVFLHKVKDHWYIREDVKGKRSTLKKLGKISKSQAEIELKKWKRAYPSLKRDFDVIYADPPWRYDFSISNNRKVENKYSTMDLDELCSLDVPAAKSSILYLWVTNPKLLDGLKVLDSWRFTYRTNFVWVKSRIGMGYHNRSRHELLLVGTRGDMQIPKADERYQSVINAPVDDHSKKPETVYDIIEGSYPPSKYKLLEMFARKRREGWVSWGNEL